MCLKVIDIFRGICIVAPGKGFLQKNINVGRALYGLSRLLRPTKVHCNVSNDYFIFIGSGFDNEVGRIEIKNINNIAITKEGTTTQRLTMTRMAVFGVFALAMPKKKKHIEYNIVIDYTTERGNETAVFEVPESSLNTVYNNLKKYLPVQGGV